MLLGGTETGVHGGTATFAVTSHLPVLLSHDTPPLSRTFRQNRPSMVLIVFQLNDDVNRLA